MATLMGREIVYYPDPVLRRRAAPVEVIDDELRDLARDMLALMYEKKGVGLAAPQVGVGRRLFVMNPTGKPEDERILVNPRILGKTGRVIGIEGCLSIPDVQGKIERATSIEVEAFSVEGEDVRFEAGDFPARVMQHEIDHLDGILIIDKMSEAERAVAAGKLKDLKARYEERRRTGPAGPGNGASSS